MDSIDTPGGPWKPDRTWADPLIVLLALVAVVLSWVVLQRRSDPPPPLRAGMRGRMAELPVAAGWIFGPKGDPFLKPGDLRQTARTLTEPWDRAVAGVLLADQGDLPEGRRLALDGERPGPAAADFQRCWERAFEGGPAVSPRVRAAALEALGNGWAAGLLEARLDARDGGDGATALQRAAARIGRRLAVIALLGLLGVCAGLAGLGVALTLLLMKRRRPAPPTGVPACSGRGLLLVFLGWFLGLLLSGTLTAPLFQNLPQLRPYALAVNVSLHAGWGTLLLRLAQGSAWSGYWRSLWAGPWRRSIGWGFGHLALAVPVVLAVAWAASPLLRRFPSPQREMMEFLAAVGRTGPLLATALVVIVIAPCFEELLFRGALLPHLATKWGWTPAILVSGLLFGAIHLQPAGLPTLGALGVILGAAFRRGGGLLSPILVHALWNGAVFLFLRTMAS